MKKSYVYEAPFYFIEVVLVGITSVVVLLIALFLAIFYPIVPKELLLLLAVIAGYQSWNTFVSLSNPETVTISDTSISFSGFNRIHEYRIQDIETFLVRPFPSSGKAYVRVNKHGILKGRYWVPTKMFDDGKELFDYLIDLEYKIHPNSIKAKARRVNTAYIMKQRSKSKNV